MRITNDQGLPQAIVDAVDTFHRGEIIAHRC